MRKWVAEIKDVSEVKLVDLDRWRRERHQRKTPTPAPSRRRKRWKKRNRALRLLVLWPFLLGLAAFLAGYLYASI